MKFESDMQNCFLTSNSTFVYIVEHKCMSGHMDNFGVLILIEKKFMTCLFDQNGG